MEERLTAIEKRQERLPPTFAFIDPYGFSSTPMSIIGRLMCYPDCEVLITFMYEEINRFLSSKDKAIQCYYDNLFGTSEWRGIADPSNFARNRERLICDLYRTQLQIIGNTNYVCMFRMLNKKNATDYFLVFGTNNRNSLEKIKDVFWEIDPRNGYNFSDFDNHTQLYLFPPEPDYESLKGLLISRFGGAITNVSEIDTFVLTETSFRRSGYREHVLKPMEVASLIRVTSSNPNRRYGDYTDAEHIRFL
jgi:hypothetical protein